MRQLASLLGQIGQVGLIVAFTFDLTFAFATRDWLLGQRLSCWARVAPICLVRSDYTKS